VSSAVKALHPDADVIGVEPAGADDTSRSLRAGHRVAIDAPATIADGLLAHQPGQLTFPINAKLLTDIVTVDEESIVAAMRFALTRLKIIVEPSGAVPLAALLSGVVRPAGRTTVLVLSGGNVDPAALAGLLQDSEADRYTETPSAR
jgi:threonine dehydratase